MDTTKTYSKPLFYGYDTGSRLFSVTCHCAKTVYSQLAYEAHMMTKHPREAREIKKSGAWAQQKIDGWVSLRRSRKNSGT